MIQILSVVTPKMATISNFVTHIVSSNVNLMPNNRFEQAKAMTFYDPSSNKPSTVQGEIFSSVSLSVKINIVILTIKQKPFK